MQDITSCYKIRYSDIYLLAQASHAPTVITGGKVTCPLCKIIWEDCRAFEPCDFVTTMPAKYYSINKNPEK